MGPRKKAKTNAAGTDEKMAKSVAGSGISKAAKPKPKPRGRPRRSPPSKSGQSTRSNDDTGLSKAQIAICKKKVASIRREKAAARKATAKVQEAALAPEPPSSRMATRGTTNTNTSKKSMKITTSSIQPKPMDMSDRRQLEALALPVNETRINPRFIQLAEYSVLPSMVVGIAKKDKKSREIKEAVRRTIKIEPGSDPDTHIDSVPMILESVDIKSDPDSAYSSPHEISPPNSPIAKRIKQEIPDVVDGLQQNLTNGVGKPRNLWSSKTSIDESNPVENVISIGDFSLCKIVNVSGSQLTQKQKERPAAVKTNLSKESVNTLAKSYGNKQWETSPEFMETTSGPGAPTNKNSLQAQTTSSTYLDQNGNEYSELNVSDIPLPDEEYVPVPPSHLNFYDGPYSSNRTFFSNFTSYGYVQPGVWYGYADHKQQYSPPYPGSNFYQWYPQSQYQNSAWQPPLPPYPIKKEEQRPNFTLTPKAQIGNQSYSRPQYVIPQSQANKPYTKGQHSHANPSHNKKFESQSQEKPWLAYRPNYLKYGPRKPRKKKSKRKKELIKINTTSSGNGNGNPSRNESNKSTSFIDCPSCHRTFYEKTLARKHFEECIRIQKK